MGGRDRTGVGEDAVPTMMEVKGLGAAEVRWEEKMGALRDGTTAAAGNITIAVTVVGVPGGHEVIHHSYRTSYRNTSEFDH